MEIALPGNRIPPGPSSTVPNRKKKTSLRPTHEDRPSAKVILERQSSAGVGGRGRGRRRREEKRKKWRKPISANWTVNCIVLVRRTIICFSRLVMRKLPAQIDVVAFPRPPIRYIFPPRRISRNQSNKSPPKQQHPAFLLSSSLPSPSPPLADRWWRDNCLWRTSKHRNSLRLSIKGFLISTFAVNESVKRINSSLKNKGSTL